MKRLFVKLASSGVITAPDFSAGDPAISVRLSQLGTPIDCGVPHLYLVYYRDPFVLGGCPASSTFNSPTTGRVDWSL